MVIFSVRVRVILGKKPVEKISKMFSFGNSCNFLQHEIVGNFWSNATRLLLEIPEACRNECQSGLQKTLNSACGKLSRSSTRCHCYGRRLEARVLARSSKLGLNETRRGVLFPSLGKKNYTVICSIYKYIFFILLCL